MTSAATEGDFRRGVDRGWNENYLAHVLFQSFKPDSLLFFPSRVACHGPQAHSPYFLHPYHSVTPSLTKVKFLGPCFGPAAIISWHTPTLLGIPPVFFIYLFYLYLF